MRITSIQQQQKRTDRYSIYLDEQYSFSLSESDLIAMGLYKDQEIDSNELAQLKQNSQIGKAYDRAIRLIALRPRSRWEIEDYLARKGYDEKVTKAVIEKLQKLDLVNDATFANQWVQWRLNSANRSRRQLVAELRKKRINNELIAEVLTEVGESAELAQLKNLIERKGRLSQYQDQQKLMAYLARQGYSYDLIKRALNEREE